MRQQLRAGKSAVTGLRLLAVSFVFTFALAAHAKYESFFYTFKNGNKLEYQIDSKNPEKGRLLLHIQGHVEPEVLRENIRFVDVNISSDQRSLASRVRNLSFSPNSLKYSVVAGGSPVVIIGLDSRKDPNYLAVDEGGAVGRIPHRSFSNLATATVKDGSEKYLVASLYYETKFQQHRPGTLIIRSSDDKHKEVSNIGSYLDRGHPSVNNGVLTIPEIPEKFDLHSFAVIRAPETPSLRMGSAERDNELKELAKAPEEKYGPEAPSKPVASAPASAPASASQVAAEHEEKPFKIPFNGVKEKSSFALEHGNEKYLVVSLTGDPAVKGTYVGRYRDNLLVKIDHAPHSLHATKYFVEDGILTIDGLRRKVDLDAFYGESLFQASRIKDVVRNQKEEAIDSTQTVLETYKKDYVAMAKADPAAFYEKADPAVVEELAEALRSKRSAVLLGEAGTGKTSAMKALARMIAKGEVPNIPRTLKILEVNTSQIESGASLVGITAERIGALKAAAQDGGIIYAMDEIHRLSGLGTHSNKSTDMAQDIKPEMETGDLRILGASTDHEFKNAFAKDPAFMDRFEIVPIKEPAGEELIQMVTQKMAREHPKAKPSRAIIEEAIHLSNEFDVRSRQPRAAVNLMKKAYAILDGKRGNEGTTVPDSAVLKEAVVKRYGVDPARFSREATRKSLAKLAEGLDDRIVGNAEGKRVVESVWMRKLTGVGDPEFVNTVLFRGPPGTGKTMLAKASAEEMGYDFTVIEMNKFAQSANGIEDFRREVYSELMKNPFRVIILDEIEKAPITVQDAALSMLQDGKFRVIEKLAHGGEVPRDVKAKHVLFMMTTNAAGNSPELTGDELKAALHRGNISKPLLSRIETIEFLKRPSADEFKTAVTKYLRQSLERESEKQKAKFVFANESEYIDKLMKSFTPESDYRDVKKLIRNEVDLTIAKAVLHFRDGVHDNGKVELHWHPEHQSLMFKCVIDQIQNIGRLNH